MCFSIKSSTGEVILENIQLSENFTGFYTCSGKLNSGEIERIEYYIYFYPSK